MFPYRMPPLPQLFLEDYSLPLGYAWIIHLELSNNSGFQNIIALCDKSGFHNNEVVNKHIDRSLWPKEPLCCRRGTSNIKQRYVIVWNAQNKEN